MSIPTDYVAESWRSPTIDELWLFRLDPRHVDERDVGLRFHVGPATVTPSMVPPIDQWPTARMVRRGRGYTMIRSGRLAGTIAYDDRHVVLIDASGTRGHTMRTDQPPKPIRPWVFAAATVIGAAIAGALLLIERVL